MHGRPKAPAVPPIPSHPSPDASSGPGDGLPRIYADFNGVQESPRKLERHAVPLDTWGSLTGLANAGIVLREGLRLTIWSDSDESEELEADTEVYWDVEQKCWMAEIDERGHRYVPARRQAPVPLVCVSCRAPLEEVITRRGLRWGDPCPSCGEAIHRPVLPP